MLPMRDGVRLHTCVDAPVLHIFAKPAILERSPYGDDSEELLATVLATALDYYAVRQDFRGTKQSEGNFTVWHDANDAYDTIAWIVAQDWSDGNVFATGLSADGIDVMAQLSNPHPALRATVTAWASAQGYETFYPGGAYREALIEGWLKSTVPSVAAATEVLIKSNESPSGKWWTPLNGSLWYGNVDFPSLHAAGWYDIFQRGNLEAYNGFQTKSKLRGQAKLFVDPLGAWGGGEAGRRATPPATGAHPTPPQATANPRLTSSERTRRGGVWRSPSSWRWTCSTTRTIRCPCPTRPRPRTLGTLRSTLWVVMQKKTWESFGPLSPRRPSLFPPRSISPPAASSPRPRPPPPAPSASCTTPATPCPPLAAITWRLRADR